MADADNVLEKAQAYIAADIRLFSGCQDAQTSADVSSIESFKLPDPAGQAGGACTSGLLQVLYADHQDQAQDLSFEDVILQLRENLASDSIALTQIPQLSSSRPMDMKQPFHIVPQDKQEGTRRAVMIGINYTGQDGELSGCQNDCKNMTEYLKNVHGFQDEHITLLLDDGSHTKPTRTNITNAFKEVVQVSEPGDVVFCHFSGHGGKIKDFDGDEEDGWDETLIPVDWDNGGGQIRDDYLFQKLVCPMKEGVTMTCVFDCCHSGTVLDLPYVFKGDGNQENMKVPDNFTFGKLEQAVMEDSTVPVDETSEENAVNEDVPPPPPPPEDAPPAEDDQPPTLEECTSDDHEPSESGDDSSSSGSSSSSSSSSSEEGEQVAKPTRTATKPTRARPPQLPDDDDGPEPHGDMTEIYVKYKKEQYSIRADLDEKIAKIKEDVEKETGVPVAQQHLVYNSFNRPFRDDKTLRYYRCLQGACFTLTTKG